MNEFIVDTTVPMTPEQVVNGTMGISLEQLINAIRENRNWEFDSLFIQKTA